MDLAVNTRANAAIFDGSMPKPGLEINLGVDLVGTLYSDSILSSSADLLGN
jgi:hypothetical protein